MANFSSGLKINRLCSFQKWVKRCRQMFPWYSLCLVYGWIILLKIWCPILVSLVTPLPYWLIKKFREKKEKPAMGKELKLLEPCSSKVKNYAINRHFALHEQSLTRSNNHTTSDWCSHRPRWCSHCHPFHGLPSRRRCRGRQTSRNRSPPTVDI